jgi:hypothetical protein
MSFTVSLTEAAWEKLVAWSALVLAGASLTLMLFYVVVLGLADFSPFAELQMAGRNPAAYRLSAALDILNWLGIGGLLVGFAAFFAARAPIRAVLLAACAVGQIVGAIGGALRLDAITELAARYTAAGADQQAVLGTVYLTLAQTVGSHYAAGQLLYGAGYLLIAGIAFSHAGLPRWIAAWFAVSGAYAIANQLSVVAVGELLPGFLFMAFQIGDAVLALAVFATFWRRSCVPSPRIGLASAG